MWLVCSSLQGCFILPSVGQLVCSLICLHPSRLPQNVVSDPKSPSTSSLVPQSNMTQTLNFQIPMKENLTGAAWLSCAPVTYPAADRWEGCMVCRAAPCRWRAMVSRSFKEGMWEGRKWQAFSVEPFYLTWSLYFWEIEMIIIPTSCNYGSWAMCCLALMKTRTRVRILLGKVQRHLNAAAEWIVGPMLQAWIWPLSSCGGLGGSWGGWMFDFSSFKW